VILLVMEGVPFAQRVGDPSFAMRRQRMGHPVCIRFAVCLVMSQSTATAMWLRSLICRLLEEVVAFDVWHLEVEDVRYRGGYVDQFRSGDVAVGDAGTKG
jgi:hypothetical protein